VPGRTAVPPVADEGGLRWRSDQNLSPLQGEINFGNHKRDCKATSSPSVKTPLKSEPLSSMVLLFIEFSIHAAFEAVFSFWKLIANL
jgi:hypothetical protein